MYVYVCLSEFSLFSLYGVGWSHVVTGDVTFLSSVDGASLPPVAFPTDKRKRILQINNQFWSFSKRLCISNGDIN